MTKLKVNTSNRRGFREYSFSDITHISCMISGALSSPQRPDIVYTSGPGCSKLKSSSVDVVIFSNLNISNSPIFFVEKI